MERVPQGEGVRCAPRQGLTRQSPLKGPNTENELASATGEAKHSGGSKMWRFLAQPRASGPAEANAGGKASPEANASAELTQPKDTSVLQDIQSAVNSSRGAIASEATDSPLKGPSLPSIEVPEAEQELHKENPEPAAEAGTSDAASQDLQGAADATAVSTETSANPLVLPSEAAESVEKQGKNSAPALVHEEDEGEQTANGADVCPSPVVIREIPPETGVWDELGEFERKMGPRPAAADVKTEGKVGPSSDTGEAQGAGLAVDGESPLAGMDAGTKGEEELEAAQAEVEEAVKEREGMERRHTDERDLIWRKGLSLNVELAKARHQKEALKRGMKEAEKQHKADCIWARRRILNLQAEVKKQQEEVNSMQAEADKVQEQRRVETELAQSEVASLESELSALRQTKEGMEAESKRHLEMCKAARRQVMQLKQEIASLQKEAAEAREKRSVEEKLVQGTLAALQQQRDELKALAAGSGEPSQVQSQAPTNHKASANAPCPEESEWQLI